MVRIFVDKGTFPTMDTVHTMYIVRLEAKTNFLACISEKRMPEKEPKKWGVEFQKQLYACIKLHIPIEKYEMDAFKGINVEYKYFLPMDGAFRGNRSTNCTWLTVGIGNSTQAEKEFSRLYANRCKLFGVELVPANEDDFATLGTVIHAGIGKVEWQVYADNKTQWL